MYSIPHPSTPTQYKHPSPQHRKTAYNEMPAHMYGFRRAATVCNPSRPMPAVHPPTLTQPRHVRLPIKYEHHPLSSKSCLSQHTHTATTPARSPVAIPARPLLPSARPLPTPPLSVPPLPHTTHAALTHVCTYSAYRSAISACAGVRSSNNPPVCDPATAGVAHPPLPRPPPPSPAPPLPPPTPPARPGISSLHPLPQGSSTPAGILYPLRVHSPGSAVPRSLCSRGAA